MQSTMQSFMELRLVETVSLDHRQLGALYDQLGEVSAEDVVCRALEELALRLAHCERLHRAGNLEDMRKSARSLVAISEQIGLVSLAAVARDVTNCVDSADTVALAATLHRLVRIGEGSLTAIWNMQDITI